MEKVELVAVGSKVPWQQLLGHPPAGHMLHISHHLRTHIPRSFIPEDTPT